MQTGVGEYRRSMASVHEHVVRTGQAAVITRDGVPYVRVVPATAEDRLARLAEEGRVRLPSSPRADVVPIDAGGADTTEIVAGLRR